MMDTLYFVIEQTMFFAIPLLVVATGAMYSERSGVVNIALEGIMIIGAFCGICAINVMSGFLSGQILLIATIAVAGLAGLAYSQLHAWSSVRLMADQTISGTALNIIAAALCIFLARISTGSKQITFTDQFFIEKVPGLGDIPVIGPMFFQNCYITTYIGIGLFLLLAVIIGHTRFGMRLSACGENPEAAASAGINVSRMRNLGVLISGMMGGMGGIIFVVPTSTTFSASVSGYGFLALAVLILGQWKAKWVLPAAFFFGLLKAVASSYSGIGFLADMNLPSEVFKMIPYVLTILVLAVSSSRSRAPKANGIPYDDGKKGTGLKKGAKRAAVITAIVVFAAGSCTIAYCNAGKDSATGVSRGYGGEIALVMNKDGSIDDKSFFQGAWEGIRSYCENGHNVSHKYYQTNDDSTGSIATAIKTAKAGGAKIIVTAGIEEAPAVYKMQDKYKDSWFLLIDETPHTRDYSDEKIAGNTVCVTFKEEESGFLAGYAAVMDGYRNLGFIGGKAVAAVIRYGYGFAAGADAAAKELKLGKGDVTLRYNYSGTFESNPETLAQASSWYKSGTEVIFACGGAMGNSVMKAAENSGGKTIGVDMDQSGESETVITSAMKDIKEATELVLTRMYAGDESIGGKAVRIGTDYDCVKLPMETSKFENFDEERYEAIYKRVKSGEFQIPNDQTTSDAGKLPLDVVEVKVIK